MEPSEYKERNVMEGNFIRNIKVDVRRQDSTKEMMSLGKNKKKHCIENLLIHSFRLILPEILILPNLKFTLTAISQLSKPLAYFIGQSEPKILLVINVSMYVY